MKGEEPKHSILNALNPMRAVNFMQSLNRLVGVEFLLMLTSTYLGIKGYLFNFLVLVQLPYFQAARVDGATLQLSTIVILTPFAIKGLIGVISDLLPLMGYYRRYYLVLSSILGTTFCIVLLFLPQEFVYLHPTVVAVFMSIIMLQISVCDLLLEGKYVIYMKQKPESKTSLVSFVWFLQISGQVLPALTVGLLSDVVNPQYIFSLYIPIAAQPLIFLYCGCLTDDECPPEASNRINREKLIAQYKPMMLAVLISLGSIGTAVLSALDLNPYILLAYSLTVVIILSTAGFMLLPRMIAIINLFMMLQASLYVDITGALDYFYTGKPNCIPNGPHFDYSYYRTYSSVVSAFASLFGVVAFQSFLSQLKLWWILSLTFCVLIVASAFDFIIVMRYNLILGISDKWMYMFGDSMVTNFAVMMCFLPTNFLIAKICPKSIETTVFAILAGYTNFGQNLARTIGLVLMDAFNIKTLPTETTDCDFSKLPLLIVVAHMITPLINIFLAFVLIPNKRLTDDFLNEEEEQQQEVETMQNAQPLIQCTSKIPLHVSDKEK